ncbi:MAG: MFS transporter, partial [SAR202 cluster bacterium]|nr:MFS transporter [SAR202 cluster bacterium]
MTTGAAEARPARKGIFYGWYIVAASIVTNCLVTAAYFQGFQAFVLPILLTFGWTNTQLSGATSARQVESGVVGPVAGFLADQVGPRKLIIAGAVVVGLGLMGLSQTRNLAMYYFFFLLISVGTAGATHGVTWPIIISRWFKKRRGRAIGIAMTGPVLGGVMALPNTYFIGLWGWRPVMFAYGVIVVVVVTLMGLVARDRPEPYGYLPDGEVPDGAGAPRAAQHRAKGQGVTASAPAGEAGFTVRQVLRSRAFWLLSLFLGALGMTSSAFGLWQMPYFVDRG